MPFGDDVAWVGTGRTASLLAYLASAPLALPRKGTDASREDRDAPSVRWASFEDGRSGDPPPGGVVSPTDRLTLKRLAAAGR